MKSIGLVVFMFLSAITSSYAIDCKNATSKTELIICSDEELIRLDSSLNSAYSSALILTPDKDEFKKSQKEWLKFRDDYDDIKILQKIYKNRISVFKEMSDLGVMKTVTCNAEYGNTIQILSCEDVGEIYLMNHSSSMINEILLKCKNNSKCSITGYFKEGTIKSLISIKEIPEVLVKFISFPGVKIPSDNIIETKKINIKGTISFGAGMAGPHFYFSDGNESYYLIYAYDERKNIVDYLSELSKSEKSYMMNCTIDVGVDGNKEISPESEIEILPLKE